jgi:hypothetical protein
VCGGGVHIVFCYFFFPCALSSWNQTLELWIMSLWLYHCAPNAGRYLCPCIFQLAS